MVPQFNAVQVAYDFLAKIHRQNDEEAKEKVVYWLNQGAGHNCDACKVGCVIIIHVC